MAEKNIICSIYEQSNQNDLFIVFFEFLLHFSNVDFFPEKYPVPSSNIQLAVSGPSGTPGALWKLGTGGGCGGEKLMRLVESWQVSTVDVAKVAILAPDFWRFLAHGHFTETTNIPFEGLRRRSYVMSSLWLFQWLESWKVGKLRLELGMISSFDLYEPVGHIKIMGVSAKIAELTGIGRRSVKGTAFRLHLSGSKVSWASNGHFPGWPIWFRPWKKLFPAHWQRKKHHQQAWRTQRIQVLHFNDVTLQYISYKGENIQYI